MQKYSFTTKLYKWLEEEYLTSLDAGEVLKHFSSSVNEEQEMLWMEARLLEAKGEGLFRMWETDIRTMTITYCKERLGQVKNLHLKVKYTWDLWWLTEEKNFNLLAQAKELTLQLMNYYLPKNDYDSASEFCDFFKLLYPICCKGGGIKELVKLVKRALYSKNETLKFQLLAKIYHQEQEDINIANKKPGYEGKEMIKMLKWFNQKDLAALSIEMADKEKNDNKVNRLLDFAVYYASKANDSKLAKDANLRMGDYIIAHLMPEDDKNLGAALIRDSQLEKAMGHYKIAGAKEKLRDTILVFEINKKKLVIPKQTGYISIEERNRQISAMNKLIMMVLDGGCAEVLNTLFGYSFPLFPDKEMMEKKAKKRAEKFYYTQFTKAVQKDENMNSRNTTHENIMVNQAATNFYMSFSFHVYTLIIGNAVNEMIMTYKELKRWLLNRGFDFIVDRNQGSGEMPGSTYMERVDLGLRDFIKLNSKFLKQQNADWRYCITFLTTQFEGLLRDIVERLGEPVTRQRVNSIELIPLEGLLNCEALKMVFDERDIFLFRQTFTNSGYNIRNKVAHGMMHPDDYTALVGLLVFQSILRLSKATFKLKMNNPLSML